MKKIRLVMLAAMLLSGVSFAMAKGSEEVKSEEAVFKVGMHCGGCKAKVEKNIAKEAGVVDLTADLESKLVTVHYDPAKTNETQLIAAITNLNLTCEKVEPGQTGETTASASDSPAKGKSGGCCSAKKTASASESPSEAKSGGCCSAKKAANGETKSGGCCSAKKTASASESPSETKSGGCCSAKKTASGEAKSGGCCSAKKVAQQ
jgi:copper chaperone CopZ